jgi:glutamate/tyrosine decarboxylase-like PLP-dependent enzyme
MGADALRRALTDVGGPIIVCAQAGNVNTGAFDPLSEIAPIVHEARGWLHVDGAFGVWAAASPSLKSLTSGLALADSVSVDGHKWLNVPYDCGFAFVRDEAAHRESMTLEAPYYVRSPDAVRANHNYVPEASRRARGFAVYAALRSLGREGITDLVERCSRLAKRMAGRLAGHPRVRILNDVVLNQVLVRFEPDSGDADALAADVIRRVQEDGTCWVGGTTWHGMHVMRISISNWSTTESDVDLSADAILRCIPG